MDVVVWLRSLGLEEYEVAFRGNKIDVGSRTQHKARDIRQLHRVRLIVARENTRACPVVFPERDDAPPTTIRSSPTK